MIRVSSLDMIGRGMTWQSIRLRSNVTHVHTGLTRSSSHVFTCKSDLVHIKHILTLFSMLQTC